METIFTETGDSKYRPALTMKKMVRAGLLGQKTGRGLLPSIDPSLWFDLYMEPSLRQSRQGGFLL